MYLHQKNNIRQIFIHLHVSLGIERNYPSLLQRKVKINLLDSERVNKSTNT